MKEMMQAIVLHEIGAYSLDIVPVPMPSEAEVLIRVAVAGICRTDVKIIEVGHRDLELPRVPAEEVVGCVCALGDGVDTRWMNKRAYVYPGTSCGVCEQCIRGAGNLCESMRIMGFHRDGGFAEYVAAPVASVIELPDNLQFDHAVFAEPLSCCLNALEMAKVTDGDRVGIWGAGPAGTLLTRAARSMGAKVTIIEPDSKRGKFAEAMENIPETPCFDVVIPAVGSADAYHSAMKSLLPRGRIVAFSGLANKVSSDVIDLNQLHYMEQTCVGAYGCSFRHGEQAIEMISNGSVKVDDLISHRMTLSEIDKALDLVRKRESMKILIYPNESECDQNRS